MTHFGVMVIGDEDINDVMEPFSENLDVEPYRKEVDQDSIDRAVEHYKIKRTVRELKKIWKDWDGRTLHHDDEGYYVMSTYNPRSKYDYFRVLETTSLGEMNMSGGRIFAAKQASDEYDKYLAIVAEHGPIPPIPDNMGDRNVHRAYWEHQTLVAMVEARLLSGWNPSPPNDEFGVTKEEYIKNRENWAELPYATLYKGEWIEPGKVLYWGMSTDGHKERVAYAQRVRDILDSLPPETKIRHLDCHI